MSTFVFVLFIIIILFYSDLENSTKIIKHHETNNFFFLNCIFNQ